VPPFTPVVKTGGRLLPGAVVGSAPWDWVVGGTGAGRRTIVLPSFTPVVETGGRLTPGAVVGSPPWGWVIGGTGTGRTRVCPLFTSVVEAGGGAVVVGSPPWGWVIGGTGTGRTREGPLFTSVVEAGGRPPGTVVGSPPWGWVVDGGPKTLVKTGGRGIPPADDDAGGLESPGPDGSDDGGGWTGSDGSAGGGSAGGDGSGDGGGSAEGDGGRMMDIILGMTPPIPWSVVPGGCVNEVVGDVAGTPSEAEEVVVSESAVVEVVGTPSSRLGTEGLVVTAVSGFLEVAVVVELPLDVVVLAASVSLEGASVVGSPSDALGADDVSVIVAPGREGPLFVEIVRWP
jgi:hypothetical protein